MCGSLFTCLWVIAYDFVLSIGLCSKRRKLLRSSSSRLKIYMWVCFLWCFMVFFCMCVLTHIALFYAWVFLLMNVSSRPITHGVMCICVQLNLYIKGDFFQFVWWNTVMYGQVWVVYLSEVYLLHEKSNTSDSCVCVTSANESADLTGRLCWVSEWVSERERGRKKESQRGGLMQGSLTPTLLADSHHPLQWLTHPAWV